MCGGLAVWGLQLRTLMAYDYCGYILCLEVLPGMHDCSLHWNVLLLTLLCHSYRDIYYSTCVPTMEVLQVVYSSAVLLQSDPISLRRHTKEPTPQKVESDHESFLSGSLLSPQLQFIVQGFTQLLAVHTLKWNCWTAQHEE